MKDDPDGAAKPPPNVSSLREESGEGRGIGELSPRTRPLCVTPAPSPSPQLPQPGKEGSPYPKAELLPRLLARLFDLMVCGALIALMHRAGAAAAAVYLLLGDALFRGQSLGKRMLGIRVVHVPTRKGAGARQSALRNFPMALLGLLAMGPAAQWKLLAAFSLALLGYEAVRVLIHPLGLRIGDELAKTQVVDAKVIAGAPALVATPARPATGGYDRMPRAARQAAPPGWIPGPNAFGP